MLHLPFAQHKFPLLGKLPWPLPLYVLNIYLKGETKGVFPSSIYFSFTTSINYREAFFLISFWPERRPGWRWGGYIDWSWGRGIKLHLRSTDCQVQGAKAHLGTKFASRQGSFQTCVKFSIFSIKHHKDIVAFHKESWRVLKFGPFTISRPCRSRLAIVLGVCIYQDIGLSC
jgi:hypothetical protein